MKLLYSNLKRGEVKILTQNLDDLWYLSTIIDPKDIVKGKTLRKIKSQSNQEKSKEATKRAVFIKINVEKVEFSKYSNVLRVAGVIREAPEEVPLGEHHTFNVDDNTAITIIKNQWLKYQLDKLKEASSERKSSLLICVHDREEAYFALLKKYGYEVLSHIQGQVQKKREDNAKKENFYLTIITKLKDYVERYKIKQIILASPSFWKEELLKELKDDELKKKMILATCSSATKNGIDEVIKRPEVREALKQERTAKEMNKVEGLFTEISKNNLAVYGLKETENASAMGAVKDLLITDSFIRKSRMENFYNRVENVMRTVDKTKGHVEIISSEHEGGKKLDGLGGIGAILRFKLNY
jgi:protein pelota|tara:strand:+ start:2540 stop:3604 length:1065 start_codon:yes stop_codon:yes gene_type:complete